MNKILCHIYSYECGHELKVRFSFDDEIYVIYFMESVIKLFSIERIIQEIKDMNV